MGINEIIKGGSCAEIENLTAKSVEIIGTTIAIFENNDLYDEYTDRIAESQERDELLAARIIKAHTKKIKFSNW